MDLFNAAKAIQPELVELRRYFHAHPEQEDKLPATEAKAAAELDKWGIPYTMPECGGIIATVGKAGGKSILLRADMDALPIIENTGLEFSSENHGTMHACGHDLHLTMLLGAARLLKERENKLDGQVILCFQEAEEIMKGAKRMLSAGVFDPLPDYAFAFHIFPSDTLKTGTISCTAGRYMASIDTITIKVKGVGAHGSSPHQGVNPITAAIALIQAMTDLLRYEVDSRIPSMLSICRIHSGAANNIVPEYCECGGTLRMQDERSREFVKRRLQELARGIESAYNVNIELIATEGAPCLFNDPEFTRMAHSWLKEMPEALLEDIGTRVNMVSEDFAEFTRVIPGALFEIASLSPEGRHFSGHNPCVIFDEEALYQGSAALAQIAMGYLR